MDRKIAFKALVGSENYHLATEESDKDYKVFVIPTYSDLYYGKMYTRSISGNKVDEEFHDIRKVVNLWWKSNVNFVEVLFSTEIFIHEDKNIKRALDTLLAMKQDIAVMNLPYLYKACKGMFLSKSKNIEHGNSATTYLVDRYGYDSKSAMHAYRILDFIERFAQNEFSDFEGAMKYDQQEREFMLAIKRGAYTKEEFTQLLKDKLKSFNELEKIYIKQNTSEHTKMIMEGIIYEMTATNIRDELLLFNK